MAKLTDKQRRFVAEYLLDLNAAAAARRAGYSAKTAEAIGHENLRKPQIAEEIHRQQRTMQEKLQVTKESVLEELAAIAQANATDFVTINANGLLNIKPTSQVPKEKLSAISCIKYTANGIEIKLHDKVRALELLGKYLGLFETGKATETGTTNLLELINDTTSQPLDSTSEIPELEGQGGGGT